MDIFNKMVEKAKVEIDLKFKENYNFTLQRYYKAEKYLNNHDIDIKLRDNKRNLDEFHKIARKLSTMMQQYKTVMGKPMTDEIIFNGFTDKEC